MNQETLLSAIYLTLTSISSVTLSKSLSIIGREVVNPTNLTQGNTLLSESLSSLLGTFKSASFGHIEICFIQAGLVFVFVFSHPFLHLLVKI